MISASKQTISSLFKQTTTYDPIYSLLNAESEDVRDKLTDRFREEKIQELNFIGIVVSSSPTKHSSNRHLTSQGALLAGVLSSTGDWPQILSNGTRTPWPVRACWYSGLIIALTSVVTAAQQAIRLHRLAAHPQHNASIRRLLASNRRNKEGMILPRRLQVFAWQMSGWLLIVSALCMLAGLMILLWSSTLTDAQQKYANWWNNDAKLAVTFTIVTGFLFILTVVQQVTLYSKQNNDDSDQSASRKLENNRKDQEASVWAAQDGLCTNCKGAITHKSQADVSQSSSGV